MDRIEVARVAEEETGEKEDGRVGGGGGIHQVCRSCSGQSQSSTQLLPISHMQEGKRPQQAEVGRGVRCHHLSSTEEATHPSVGGRWDAAFYQESMGRE